MHGVPANPEIKPAANLPSRYPCRAMIVAHLLVVGAIVSMTVVFWHGHKVHLLREQYLRQYGAIEVPAAIYFDSIAMSVQFPLLLLWFLLQMAAAAVWCFNWRGVGYSLGLVFWMLWLMTWGLPFVLASFSSRS
jgi:hypothetical protein